MTDKQQLLLACVIGIGGVFVLHAMLTWRVPAVDVSDDRPYREMIGAEYRIVADDVYAYGTADGWPSDSTVTAITLVPGVGIGGGEVRFKRALPKGTVVRILSAWNRPMLFDDGHYYVVAIDNKDLPPGVPIEIELFRGNEAEGPELNPRVYQKFPSGR